MFEEIRSKCSFYFHRLVAVFSLTVYYADFISDIVLAVNYYKQGHKSWAMLTTACILFPVPVYMALVIYMACIYKTWNKLKLIPLIVTCFPCMPLINSFGLCSYLVAVSQRYRGMDYKFQAKRLATMNQLFEALLEASPQCVLQLYIILVDQSTTDSGDISTGRYISIATSAIAISWNFFCHEKMMFILCQVEQSNDRGGHDDRIDVSEEPVTQSIRYRATYCDMEDQYKMPFHKQLCLLILKGCECIQRVLAFAFFLSLLRFRVPFIYIILGHIVLLTITDFAMLGGDASVCKRFTNGISAAILRIVCYTSTNYLPNSYFRVFFHFIIVSIENWVFVGIWLALKPERHQWLFVPTLAVFISLFIIQLLLQLLFYIKLDNHGDKNDMTNVISVFFDMEDTHDNEDTNLTMLPGFGIVKKSLAGARD